jgi:hypothetical protein
MGIYSVTKSPDTGLSDYALPTNPPLPLQAYTWDTPNMGMYTGTIKI